MIDDPTLPLQLYDSKTPRILLLLLLCAVSLPGASLAGTKLHSKGDPFVGRWDVTVNASSSEYPDWFEVTDDGKDSPQVRLQQRTGSVHPVRAARIENKHLILELSEPGAKGPARSWDLVMQGHNQMHGVTKLGDMVNGNLVVVRAPAMKRKEPKEWLPAEPLFNGKDLNGWTPDNISKVNWVVKNGEILNQSGGANLRTTRKFGDFKLHIEVNCPNEANSGIYLRGRYEVQVEYEKPGVEDKFHEMGSIYGMLAPSRELPRKPGEWETFDITLVGRTVTMLRNGVLIHDHEEIPGITGGALDAHEAEPGPFYLQGDHTGGMRFRNITVQVPKPEGPLKKDLKKAAKNDFPVIPDK